MPLPRAATLRILVLLSALAFATFVTAYQHVTSRSWSETLEITIYPINADGDSETALYIESLKPDDFTIIDRWASREAARHSLPLKQPFRTSLGNSIAEQPPMLNDTPSALESISWSLRFRWWAWRHTPEPSSLKRVKIYVAYQQGKPGEALAHSVGLKKGLLGLVNAYANTRQHSQNTIVIAHELLHTVGAVDKYHRDGSPIWPQGFADPDRDQRHPQDNAEIMAGRVRTAKGIEMAISLQQVVLNRWTAREINWLN